MDLINNGVPKMDYIILSRDGDEVLAECLVGVRRQSNVNDIYIVGSGSRTDDIIARNILFEFPQTKYFVSVDSDVSLKPFWIEEMWLDMDNDIDFLGGYGILRIILDGYRKDVLGHRQFPYLQASIIRTSVAKKWRLFKKDTIQYDNYVFSRYIRENGYKYKNAAVLTFHCDSFKYGRIKEYLMYNLIELDRDLPLMVHIASAIRSIFGGIRRLICLRNRQIGWISAKSALAKVAAALILRCNR